MYSKNLSVRYVFSGPTSCSSALEAEVNAFTFLCKSMGSKVNFVKGIICVDSKNLEEMFYNAKADLIDIRLGFAKIKSIILLLFLIYL